MLEKMCSANIETAINSPQPMGVNWCMIYEEIYIYYLYPILPDNG